MYLRRESFNRFVTETWNQFWANDAGRMADVLRNSWSSASHSDETELLADADSMPWDTSSAGATDTPSIVDDFVRVILPPPEPFQVVSIELKLQTEEHTPESILSDNGDVVAVTRVYEQVKSNLAMAELLADASRDVNQEDPEMEVLDTDRNKPEYTTMTELTDSFIERVDSTRLKEIVRKIVAKDRKLKPFEPALGIESEECIKNLSMKEIRKLLVEHSVDTVGCCEKRDMVQKLTQLWKDLNKHAGEVPEADRCLICMDARIDCVFLECGHQAACTECGHMIKDCPICRMYVTRVVRTYRP